MNTNTTTPTALTLQQVHAAKNGQTLLALVASCWPWLRQRLKHRKALTTKEREAVEALLAALAESPDVGGQSASALFPITDLESIKRVVRFAHAHSGSVDTTIHWLARESTAAAVLKNARPFVWEYDRVQLCYIWGRLGRLHFDEDGELRAWQFCGPDDQDLAPMLDVVWLDNHPTEPPADDTNETDAATLRPVVAQDQCTDCEALAQQIDQLKQLQLEAAERLTALELNETETRAVSREVDQLRNRMADREMAASSIINEIREQLPAFATRDQLPDVPHDVGDRLKQHASNHRQLMVVARELEDRMAALEKQRPSGTIPGDWASRIEALESKQLDIAQKAPNGLILSHRLALLESQLAERVDTLERQMDEWNRAVQAATAGRVGDRELLASFGEQLEQLKQQTETRATATREALNAMARRFADRELVINYGDQIELLKQQTAEETKDMRDALNRLAGRAHNCADGLRKLADRVANVQSRVTALET
jgi:hypothetical protein